jgi:hypothetical protein
MSVENFPEIFNDDFARRNLWEATLMDKDGNPLSWSTGLIKSTNIPKLQFTIDDIHAGTSKAYTGWKLPENLSLVIWETSEHKVEKYLDEWMLGDTGVFNPKTGAFREQFENYLFRNVQIRTFIYENKESKDYEAYYKDVVSGLYLTILKGVDDIFTYKSEKQESTKKHGSNEIEQHNLQKGPVSIQITEYMRGVLKSVAGEAVEGTENLVNQSIRSRQTIITEQRQKHPYVEKKQIIPVLDKITSAVSGLINQTISSIPLLESDIAKAIMPPVVIPPLVMSFPVLTGTPIPPPVTDSSEYKNDYIDSGMAKHIKTNKSFFKDSFTDHQSVEIIKEITAQCESKLIEFANGEATRAKQWEAEEKTTSSILYTTAIESYDIGTYDYATGDGVSYTVNLAVRDIKYHK